MSIGRRRIRIPVPSTWSRRRLSVWRRTRHGERERAGGKRRGDSRDERSASRLWWAHTGGGAGNFGIVTRYGFDRPAKRATIRPLYCRARRSRSRHSGRNGIGARSTSRPSCNFSGTMGPGASGTAMPNLKTLPSGLCCRCTGNSSERSSSAAWVPLARRPGGKSMTTWLSSARAFLS